MKKYRITTNTEFVEVYEIEAETEEKALNILESLDFALEPVNSFYQNENVEEVKQLVTLHDSKTCPNYDDATVLPDEDGKCSLCGAMIAEVYND